MKWNREVSNSVAKQRLKLMMESEPVECSPEMLVQMKKEITEIVFKYFEISPEQYEIKVSLRPNQKRA